MPSRETRSRLPVALVDMESQWFRSAALKREAGIKRLRRPDKDRSPGLRTTPGVQWLVLTESIR